MLLMLEATIGLNEVSDSNEADAEEVEGEPGSFTQNDVSFLKSLRISLPDGETDSIQDSDS